MNWGLILAVGISSVAALMGSAFLGRAVQELSENKKVFSIDAFIGIYLTVGAIILAIFAT